MREWRTCLLVISLLLSFVPMSQATDCILLCGDRAGMNTVDEQGRQGFGDVYLTARGEHIYGLLGSAELTDTPAWMQEAWARWTKGGSWPLTVYRQSAHISDWAYNGLEHTAASLAHDYLRLDKATGSASVDVVGRSLAMQYFGGPKENLTFFGGWTNLGALWGGSDAIAGVSGWEINVPALRVDSNRTTHDTWANTSGQTLVTGLVVAAIGNEGVPEAKQPTVGIGVTGGHGGSIGDGFKQAFFASGYTRQGYSASPKHYGDIDPRSAAAFYAEDWHLANHDSRLGLYIERDRNGPIWWADIEISAPEHSSIHPFLYRHGTSGGVLGDGVVTAITPAGDLAGASVTVPPAGEICLSGPSCETRIVSVGSHIQFWVGGFCRGRLSAMGFLAGC